MELEQIGLDPAEAARHAARGRTLARVALARQRVCTVWTGEGEREAPIAKRLRHAAGAAGAALAPVVGDRALLDESGALDEVLPRRTRFHRGAAGRSSAEQVVAANADVLFVVVGLDGDFNPRRIERYLVMAFEGGAEPVLVLSKADLVSEEERAARRAEAEAVAPGVELHALSALDPASARVLSGALGRGRTGALVGSSGVGKSTLVNHLLGRARQRVGEVRRRDERGQHTTTDRELLLLPSGEGLVIDTPGLRELQLVRAGSGLAAAFAELVAIAASCRFTDCGHDAEPDCAVREAMAAGRLSPERVESYRRLAAELAAAESPVGPRDRSARR